MTASAIATFAKSIVSGSKPVTDSNTKLLLAPMVLAME
jgi:hypothetical protein